MISIEGKWYDGKTSATEDVVCIVYDNGALRIERISDGVLVLTSSPHCRLVGSFATLIFKDLIWLSECRHTFT